MAMNLERNIEDAVVAQLKLRSYIINNSVVVRRFDDKATEDGTGAVAVVKAMPNERLQPNCPKYKVPLIVMVKVLGEADMEGDTMNALYQDICEYLHQDMSVSGLNTTITDVKVTIDGIFQQQFEDDRDSDGFITMAGAVWIFLTWQ